MSKQRYVYFIQGIDGGPIKIGSATDVDRRLQALRCGNPVPLRLLGVVPEDANMEALLHARWAEHRLRGEWFAPAPEILAYIAERATTHVRRPYRLEYVSYADSLAQIERAYETATDLVRDDLWPVLRMARERCRACPHCAGLVTPSDTRCDFCHSSLTVEGAVMS